MNRLVAVSVIVLISVSAVCGVLCYHVWDVQNQNSELQNQISQLEHQTSELEEQLDDLEDENIQRKTSDASQVKITGMSMYFTQMITFPLDVMVKNFGASDVAGLNLVLTTNAGDNQSITLPVGFIYAGKEKTINSVMVYSFYQESDTIFATLMLDGNILDTDEFHWH